MKLVQTLRALLIILILQGYSLYSMEKLSSAFDGQKKSYPICVGTKILKNLAFMLPLDQAGSDVHKDLLNFNRLIVMPPKN